MIRTGTSSVEVSAPPCRRRARRWSSNTRGKNQSTGPRNQLNSPARPANRPVRVAAAARRRSLPRPARRSGCTGARRRRDRRCRPGQAAVRRDGRPRSTGTSSTWPSSYWGITCGQRLIWRRIGSPLMPSRPASSRAAGPASSSSSRSRTSAWKALPGTPGGAPCPPGPRPGNFTLEKLPERICRFSTFGTTKPNPSSAWATCSRRYASETIAHEVEEIRPSRSARSGSTAGQQPPGRADGRRHDHGVGLENRRAACAAVWISQRPPLERSSRSTVTPQRIESVGQPPHQGLDQARHPLAKAHEHAVPGTAAGTSGPESFPGRRARASDAADQAAVRLLHLQEPGHRRLHAQPLGIARVHPADQRLDQSLVRLAAEPAAGERGQALVTASPGFTNNSSPIRSLPQGPRIGVVTIGQSRVGAMIMRPSGIGTSRPRETTNAPPVRGSVGNELVLEPQPPAQVQTVGQRREEAIGALLDQEPVGRAPFARRRRAGPPIPGPAPATRASSSLSRWAAASPVIPPPTITTARSTRDPCPLTSGFRIPPCFQAM